MVVIRPFEATGLRPVLWFREGVLRAKVIFQVQLAASLITDTKNYFEIHPKPGVGELSLAASAVAEIARTAKM